MIKRLKPKPREGPGVFEWKVRLVTNGIDDRKKFLATEKDAHEIYAKLLKRQAEKRLGLETEESTIAPLLSVAVDAYLLHIQQAKLNPSHRNGVAHALRILQETVNNPHVNQITFKNILDTRQKRIESGILVYDKKGRGKKLKRKVLNTVTVNKCIAHISTFFEYCRSSNWIQQNPCERVKPLTETAPELKILSWLDFCKFAQAAWEDSKELGLFIELLGETGVRISELINANVQDVDLDRRTFMRIGKGSRRLIADAGQWCLYAALRSKGILAPNTHGKRWTYREIQYAFKRLCKRAEIPRITPHWIRHGRACWMLIEGVPAWKVKETLGHSSLQTTERYLRPAEQLARAEEKGTIHTSRIIGAEI